MFYFQKAVKHTAACCRHYLFILPLYIPVLVPLTPAGLCVEHHLSRRLPLLLSEPTTCLALTVWGPVFSATGWALWGLLLLTTSALSYGCDSQCVLWAVWFHILTVGTSVVESSFCCHSSLASCLCPFCANVDAVWLTRQGCLSVDI